MELFYLFVIELSMRLVELKANQSCLIEEILLKDEKLKLRLQELGMYKGSRVEILFLSPLKQTMLVKIFNSAFALKSNIASQILVSII